MFEHLNETLLEELRELMEDQFPMLLETFLNESARQFENASEAWAGSDMEALKRTAHSLKGASSNIGADQLASLCGRLELIAKSDRLTEVPELIDAVSRELAAVRVEVESLHPQR